MEEWVPVLGFPGYSVSNLGQVKRNDTGRILSLKVTQYGTVYVGMARGLIQCQRSLGKLVAIAFLPDTIEAFDTPINLDGDRFNCEASNLMWRPRWFAVQYNKQYRNPYGRPIKAPLRCRETNEVFQDSMAAASRYGLLERDIVLSIQNDTNVWPTYLRFELVK